MITISIENTFMGFLLSAGIAGRLVGTLEAHERFENKPGIYLTELGVEEDFRRQGVATRLLEAAIARAQEAGHARVWLLVSYDNHVALRLYDRLGFEEIQDNSEMFFCVMERQLAPVLQEVPA